MGPGINFWTLAFFTSSDVTTLGSLPFHLCSLLLSRSIRLFKPHPGAHHLPEAFPDSQSEKHILTPCCLWLHLPGDHQSLLAGAVPSLPVTVSQRVSAVSTWQGSKQPRNGLMSAIQPSPWP